MAASLSYNRNPYKILDFPQNTVNKYMRHQSFAKKAKPQESANKIFSLVLSSSSTFLDKIPKENQANKSCGKSLFLLRFRQPGNHSDLSRFRPIALRRQLSLGLPLSNEWFNLLNLLKNKKGPVPSWSV